MPFFKTACWAIIPALLLAFSQWLAGTMSSGTVAIWYQDEVRTVNGVHSVYLKLFNGSEVAIDELKIVSPPKNIIHKSYSPKTPAGKNLEWEGEIQVGKSLEILYILSVEMAISDDSINNLVSARYEKRDAITGSQEWTSVPITKAGAIAFPRALRYLFWFFLPILLSLVITYAFFFFSKSNKQDEATESKE